MKNETLLQFAIQSIENVSMTLELLLLDLY